MPTKTTSIKHNTKNTKREIQENQPNSNSEEFIGVEGNKIKRLYLGGVREGVTVQLISEYTKKRGIVPTFVRLMQSKRSGTVAVRVNVNSKDVKQALENDFWPNHVYVREWLSKEKWSKKNDRHKN